MHALDDGSAAARAFVYLGGLMPVITYPLDFRGPPRDQFGAPGDRCCICNAVLSAYNPDAQCSRSSCEAAHHIDHKELACTLSRALRPSKARRSLSRASSS